MLLKEMKEKMLLYRDINMNVEYLDDVATKKHGIKETQRER